MGAGHSHDHGGAGGGVQTATGRHRRRLGIVLAIYLVIITAELVGALVTGSLALLAEAGHMAVDGSGIAIALVAAWLATRTPSARRTFGLMRAEIVAAVINCLLLFALGAYILYEAVERWQHPPEVAGLGVIAFAVVGVIGNGISLVLLTRGARESLNVRAAFLEVMSDAVGAAAIVVSGILIVTTGFYRADAIAAAAIGVIILPRAFGLLRQAMNIIMQGVPAGIDVQAIRRHVLDTDGVEDVHSLHVWAVTSGVPVLSAHIVVNDEVMLSGSGPRVLDALTECLHTHFTIQHCTFQLEPPGHRAHEGAIHRDPTDVTPAGAEHPADGHDHDHDSRLSA